MAIPDYSLTDCAVLLWVAKRTFWGKAACTCLPSRIARELGGKIAIRTIQCSLRRFELDGLTIRSSLKSGPYPNRETALTEKFWETIQSVLAGIEPRRYGSASMQFCAPYARTAHGDARFAHGDARFRAWGCAVRAWGCAVFSAAYRGTCRSVPSTELKTTTTDTASSDASLSFLAALSEESGGTGGPRPKAEDGRMRTEENSSSSSALPLPSSVFRTEALDPARLKTAVRKLVSLKLKLDANDPGPMDPATAERVIREATGESMEALRRRRLGDQNRRRPGQHGQGEGAGQALAVRGSDPGTLAGPRSLPAQLA